MLIVKKYQFLPKDSNGFNLHNTAVKFRIKDDTFINILFEISNYVFIFCLYSLFYYKFLNGSTHCEIQFLKKIFNSDPRRAFILSYKTFHKESFLQIM